MAESGTLMAGKRGVVFGVANNRSIAWGITKAVTDQGAEVALTYQGDAIKKRVEPLAHDIGSKLVLPCDVTDEPSVESVFAALAKEWGNIDFLVHAVAFSDKEQLDGRYVDTTQDNFTQTLLISCYSFTALARRAEKLMPNGGSLLTLTYYGAEKVMPHYNVMGVAKAALEASVRYLAADLGKGAIRVNAISAGPIKTSRGFRHRRLPLYPQMERVQLTAQTHRLDRGCRRRRALSPLGPRPRCDRRDPAYRCGLSRGGHEERGCPRHFGGEGIIVPAARVFLHSPREEGCSPL